MKKYIVLMAAALLSAAVCGCRSDIYYQSLAVERARQFLLKEADDLDLEQQSYVRYSDPLLLHAPCIGSSGQSRNMTLKSELRQICVTWQIPGKDKLYMVFGVSTGRMADWDPNRLVKRAYPRKHPGISELSKMAIAYARNNLFEQLSAEEMNFIRFSPPYLLISKFELERVLTPEELEMPQFSLVWKFPGKELVFCGIGNKAFGDWKIELAGFYTPQQVAMGTVKVVMTPEAAFDFELPKLPERGNKTQQRRAE